MIIKMNLHYSYNHQGSVIMFSCAGSEDSKVITIKS